MIRTSERVRREDCPTLTWKWLESFLKVSFTRKKMKMMRKKKVTNQLNSYLTMKLPTKSELINLKPNWNNCIITMMTIYLLMKSLLRLRNNSVYQETWEFIKLISNKFVDVIFQRNDHDLCGMDKMFCQIK